MGGRPSSGRFVEARVVTRVGAEHGRKTKQGKLKNRGCEESYIEARTRKAMTVSQPTFVEWLYYAMTDEQTVQTRKCRKMKRGEREEEEEKNCERSRERISKCTKMRAENRQSISGCVVSSSEASASFGSA